MSSGGGWKTSTSPAATGWRGAHGPGSVDRQPPILHAGFQPGAGVLAKQRRRGRIEALARQARGHFGGLGGWADGETGRRVIGVRIEIGIGHGF